MCKAYKKTAKAFKKVLLEKLIEDKQHMTYGEFIHELEGMTDFPYNYNTKISTREQLEHLKALGSIDTDKEGKYYWNVKNNFWSKRRAGIPVKKSFLDNLVYH